MTMFNTSPFLDFLEGSEFGPRINFLSRMPSSFGTGQQQAFSNLFQPTFNQFLGRLGGQIRQGQPPTLSFNDFLNQSFNPQREMARFPSFTSSPRLMSPTRFFFGR